MRADLRRVLRGAFLVVGVAVGGLGCGGSSSSSSVSLDQLPDAYSQAICDQNFKCASAADIMGRTKQDCLDTNKGIFQFVLPQLRASVTKGREAYDAAKMGECIAAVRALSCDQWVAGNAEPASCNEAIAPKVALGGACGGSGDCIGGFCDGADSSTNPPKDGVCTATVATGGACTSSEECGDKEYCDSTAQTCTAKKVGGTACTSDDQCTNSCNTDTNKCSGYAGCAVGGPITAGGTLASVALLGVIVAFARRRRARASASHASPASP
jgi:hypothetical protein